MIKQFIMIATLVLVGACAKDDVGLERSFYMGLSIDPTTDDIFDSGIANSEIIHFRFRESWDETPSHDSLSMSRCKAMVLSHQKVYLSVSPFSEPMGDLFLPSGFNNPEVKQTYLKYCKHLIDFFNPAFFNMTEDANQAYLHDPSSWSDFLYFHEYIYSQLKTSYPGLVIFSSVKAPPLVDGMIANNDFILQRLAVLQILDHSDLYALSFSLNEVNTIADSNLKSPFDKLFSLSPKPLALSVNESVGTNNDWNLAQLQINGLNKLLSSCLTQRTVFVVNTIKPSAINNAHAIMLVNNRETWKRYLSLNYFELK